MLTRERPRSDDEVPATQVTVVVRDEIDLATVPGLQSRIAAALHGRPERLVLDLSACPFADGRAVTLLLQTRSRAQRQGTVLVLPRPSAPVRRLLDVSGLAGALQVEP